MEALIVESPLWRIDYQGKNITDELSRFAVSLRYSDNLDGDEADSLEMTLEDSDFRWINDWYPGMGDRMQLWIGYDNSAAVDCGLFEVDSVELSGPPNQVVIKALAAGVTKALRTHNAVGYENTTLAAIADTIAAKHGLKRVGDIEPIALKRITQMHEADLPFLRRLAGEYGYAFNVRGEQLVFYRQQALRQQPPVLVLVPENTTDWQFTDQIKGTPKAAQCAYHDADSKQLQIMVVDSNGQQVKKPSADILKINTRAESKAQARARAQAAIEQSDGKATVANITLPGEPRLVAGNNVELQGFGTFNGMYQIKASQHSLDRMSGYVTRVELSRSKH